MKNWLLFGAALPLFAVGASAQERIVIPGQGQGTITFFDGRNFSGAAVTYRQDENRVRLPFSAGSIRVEGPWRVCTGPDYGGRCVTVDRDYRDARFLGLYTVGSAQSLYSSGGGGYPPGGGWGGNWGNWSGPVGGPSLRGENSLFFATPSIRGSRISACPSGDFAGCQQQTADRLCAYSGYGRAGSADRVRIGREWFLSDVLCTRR